MRFVLDTATLVAAIRSNAGASRRLLVAGLERRFTLLVSAPLLIEYEAVMTRPEHLEVSRLTVEARKLAEAEGVALNQFINVAVAEKLSALRTESYFAERAARADVPRALEILSRAGVGAPPTKGDESDAAG